LVALPPGWGFGDARRARSRLVAYIFGLMAGGVAFALLLWIIQKQIPSVPRVVVIVGLFVVSILRLLPDRLAPGGSRWRVPQKWTWFGDVTYAFVFGFCLGNGLLTAETTVGYFSIFVFALTDVGLWPIVLGMLSFALGRAAPTAYAFHFAMRTSRPPKGERLTIGRSLTGLATFLERGALAALLVFFLAT
jgi:hypothetical protein